jgi:3-methyladenine DNA glycosylase Tag
VQVKQANPSASHRGKLCALVRNCRSCERLDSSYGSASLWNCRFVWERAMMDCMSSISTTAMQSSSGSDSKAGALALLLTVDIFEKA